MEITLGQGLGDDPQAQSLIEEPLFGSILTGALQHQAQPQEVTCLRYAFQLED